MSEEKINITDEAKNAADEIYKALSGLEGEWVHDSAEFLPANVCCDFAGNARFKRMLGEIITKHTSK